MIDWNVVLNYMEKKTINPSSFKAIQSENSLKSHSLIDQKEKSKDNEKLKSDFAADAFFKNNSNQNSNKM